MQTCTSLVEQLVTNSPALVPAGSIATLPVLDSDLLIQVYSTRITPVTFLRTRVAQHLFSVLRDSSHFDSIVTSVAQNMLNDGTLDSVMLRFAVMDEPNHGHHRSFGILSSKLQRALYEHRETENRGMMVTFNGNADALRAFSGDFDSTEIKIVHTLAPDLYPFGNEPLPFRYSDTGRMHPDIVNSLFQGLTLFNTTEDHRRYTEQIAGKLSSYRFHNLVPSGGGQITPWIARVGRTVDVGQFKYPHLGPAVPVYGYVHTHGYFGEIDRYRNDSGRITVRFEHRLPTPEELTVQAWLLMNCGVQGIIYSEMLFSGASFGIMHKNWPWNHHQEYDTLAMPNSPADSNWQLPKMWVGFNSRYNAVKRVNAALYKIDSVIGWRNLVYLKEQISVHDPLMSFATFPMLDSVRAERAARNDSAFNGTETLDPADSTYLEVTHFRPDTSDTYGTNTFSRYLLFTNRRTWPIDHAPYSTGNAGLGKIDVRRPRVMLKNSTGVMADSMIVERIDATWQKTLATGTMDSLDWLEPGWGSFYRVRPKPAGVGYSGTAYNNAVHSENPSTDDTQRDRLTVYMRDSVIYLRATDSTGTWSREWMISDAADSAYVNGVRVADNMHPALATTRDASALAIVWERRQGDSAMIEMAHFYGLPRRTNFPAATRLRLAPPRALTGSWMVLAPAITGVDSGWVAAWGGRNGIGMIAVRNVPAPTPFDISAIATVKASTIDAYGNSEYPIDSSSLYPSLAYVHNGGNSKDPYPRVHLVWQQGTPNSANKQFILYNNPKVDFYQSGQQHVVPYYISEHVSTGLAACGFLHPSISADSLWIAVAFQQNRWLDRRVMLRFRDTARAPYSRWQTTAYTWGGKWLKGLTHRYYERASVTAFPSVPRPATGNAGLDGAIVWQWTNAPDGVRNHQMLYRFGAVRAREIPTGQHPSMTLVPYKKINPYDASSVFYRGDTATRFTHWRGDWGINDSIIHYPGVARSTTEPWLAMSGSVHGRISAIVDVTEFNSSDTCRTTNIEIGLRWDDLVTNPVTGSIAPSNPSHPGLPPSFFAPPFSTESRIETLSDGEKVTRTGVFPAVGTSVPIWRHFVGCDSLLAWLDRPEYNPIPGTADIKVHIELVRNSDSAVLWRGDTISARALGDSAVDYLVSVPLTGVTPNTPVFLRLRTVITGGLEYDFSAGFRFLDDEDGGSMEKRMLPRKQENDASESEENAALSLSFIPNPTRGAGTLETVARVAGRLEFALYDIRGTKVAELPALDVEQPGAYRLQFDMGSLPNGTYLMVATSNGERSTIRIQLER